MASGVVGELLRALDGGGKEIVNVKACAAVCLGGFFIAEGGE